MAAHPPRPYDLKRVFPPTPTDDPDSIVGGQPTRDFPACVALGNDTLYFCSGTLIAPTVVVSARHCATDRRLGKPTRVFLKGYDISEPTAGETVRVKAVYTHPDADLLVLVLESASSVEPCHIAQAFEVQGDTATLVGFGTINSEGTVGYGVKRRVEVPIAALNCGAAEINQYGCQQGIEMVAGHRGLNRDTCRGDSGGPLFILGPTGEYYLLGATSRAVRYRTNPCGDGGVYARVDQFIPWIEAQTGVKLEGPRL